MFVTLCEVNSNGAKFFSEGSLLQKKKKKIQKKKNLAQLAEANYPQKKKKRGIRKNGHQCLHSRK